MLLILNILLQKEEANGSKGTFRGTRRRRRRRRVVTHQVNSLPKSLVPILLLLDCFSCIEFDCYN
ncbi:hypothetical protein ACS0TY_014278 [Phlomoides rotata]